MSEQFHNDVLYVLFTGLDSSLHHDITLTLSLSLSVAIETKRKKGA